MLLIVACLLVLLGFFIHGDSQAPPEVQVAEVTTTTSTTTSTSCAADDHDSRDLSPDQ